MDGALQPYRLVECAAFLEFVAVAFAKPVTFPESFAFAKSVAVTFPEPRAFAVPSAFAQPGSSPDRRNA